MRTYDLTPFYRSTVGFDRFFSLLDQAASDGSPGYPPYTIERTGENTYRITVAVSGFSEGELSIVAKENTHTVPLRPAGGAQRANRNSAPSGVLMMPLTTSSGTGLAGIETSVMTENRLGEKGWKSRLEAQKRGPFRPS